MIKFQANCIVHGVTAVVEIPSRNGGTPFHKRELIIDDSWVGQDGVTHPNYVSIEFFGDKMAMLEGIQPGERVIVDAMVKGRVSQDGRVFNSINGMMVVRPQQYQQPVQYQQPMPRFPQQPQAPQQPYQQAPAQPQVQAQPQGDNIPF